LIATAALVLFPLTARAQGAAGALPDGEGEDLVQGICTGCHQTNMITQSSGYTREDWKKLTSLMIDFTTSPETQDTITSYLAAHFPPS
jgi:virginiamycin B lyase